MRVATIALVSTLMLAPAAAFAQSAPPGGPGGPPPGESQAPPPGGPPPGEPQAAPPGGPPPGAITREQYVERAQKAAARRFDEIDTNHLGYITRAQLRAFMVQHRGPGGPPPQQ